MEIYIKKLSDKAIIPVKGSEGAAGYDLFSTEDYELQYGERKLFKTDIAIKIPEGYYGRIAPRSGLALKQGIDIMAGVLDSDFSGNVGVILINLKKELTDYLDFKTCDTSYCFLEESVKINKGDRIAQLIIEKCQNDSVFIEVNELPESFRGDGGFGSTGK